jgi:hypothetical protein
VLDVTEATLRRRTGKLGGKREAAGVLDGEPGDLGVLLGRAIVIDRNKGWQGAIGPAM